MRSCLAGRMTTLLGYGHSARSEAAPSRWSGKTAISVQHQQHAEEHQRIVDRCVQTRRSTSGEGQVDIGGGECRTWAKKVAEIDDYVDGGA